MHPTLVMGAWVGFNDARVTMRSDYWGQGGHNALLLVGDFFRETMQAGMLDAKAAFPRPERPPVMVSAPLPYGMDAQGEIISADSQRAAPPPATTMAGIVVRRYAGGGVWIGDSQAAAQADSMAPAKTEEELSGVMSGMGRDPASGARMAARSAVDYGDRQPVSSAGASGGGDTASGSDTDSIR